MIVERFSSFLGVAFQSFIVLVFILLGVESRLNQSCLHDLGFHLKKIILFRSGKKGTDLEKKSIVQIEEKNCALFIMGFPVKQQFQQRHPPSAASQPQQVSVSSNPPPHPPFTTSSPSAASTAQTHRSRGNSRSSSTTVHRQRHRQRRHIPFPRTARTKQKHEAIPFEVEDKQQTDDAVRVRKKKEEF